MTTNQITTIQPPGILIMIANQAIMIPECGTIEFGQNRSGFWLSIRLSGEVGKNADKIEITIFTDGQKIEYNILDELRQNNTDDARFTSLSDCINDAIGVYLGEG